jgi:hypothetical protein
MTTLESRLVPRHKQAVLLFNCEITQGQPCKVSIVKDRSAQRKAVMTRTVPQSHKCLLVSNLRFTLGKVSILKDGSAQRKAVMTRTVPQSHECLPVSSLRSPLGIRSGLQGRAWHLPALDRHMGSRCVICARCDCVVFVQAQAFV